ncbi:uncharacterized protein CELE_C46C2.7 [Caenorhabditis elegans]|uniref:Uncharacterized protein n=1 Tax=Caenorhabditis elegans TaxID=6239 RepID=A0FLR2_CAEEL|nr:Uncharacterized protein CELE_C46C2.7 [Caenorhabditis elegans]CAL63992.2 Uncharacterized protein CELE_C46C2.7 [Caenorhabditis elegans]|eukprot:NP_001076667.2 Uncharacterized protein CELE_C46C2.7 [Caenorhabditis elegans]
MADVWNRSSTSSFIRKRLRASRKSKKKIEKEGGHESSEASVHQAQYSCENNAEATKSGMLLPCYKRLLKFVNRR